MTPVELDSWAEFYDAYPFDDLHRFHRPAALMSASMGSAKSMDEAVRKRLEWLAPVLPTYSYSGADLGTLKAFGIKPLPGMQAVAARSQHGEL